MRRSLDLGLFVTLTASVAACTALLGDFKTDGTAGPGAEAGEDTGGGGDASDATADGPAPPPLLKCGINGSPVDLLSGITAPSEQLAVHAFKMLGNIKRRVMWTSKQSTTVHFHTIDESLGPASIVDTPVDLTAGPQGLASYDGGFAAIGLASTAPNPPHLVGFRFDDGAVNPTTVVDLGGPASPLPPGTTDLSIAAAPTGGDGFFVVFTVMNAANMWSMYAGPTHIGFAPNPGVFKLVSSTIASRPSLSSDTLVIDKAEARAILFMPADKGQGATAVMQLDLSSGAPIGAPQVLQPLHGTSTFSPLAAQTSFGVVDRVGMAFLEYDLNNATQPVYAYATAVPAAGLSGFKTSSLPKPVSFTTPGDIAVDKGRAFWTHYPTAGSHVVEAARFTQSGKGVNFLWFDGNGNLRGKASGADALVTGDVVLGAAGTMVEAPNVIIANAAVTWLADLGSNTAALRIANVGCGK